MPIKRKKLEEKIEGKKAFKPKSKGQKEKIVREEIIKPVKKMREEKVREKVMKGGKKPKVKRNKPTKRPEDKKLPKIEKEEVKDLVGENKVERAYSGGAYELFRQKRMTRVASLYLKGHSMMDMAEALECSLQTIRTDIQNLRDEWLASRVKDVDSLKAEELARLDHLENVNWMAWERSCEVEETKRERQRYAEEVACNPAGKSGNQKAKKERVEKLKKGFKEEDEGWADQGDDPTKIVEHTREVTRRNRNGDPRFLELIAGCIQMRMKILGLLSNDGGSGHGGITINLNSPEMMGRDSGNGNQPRPPIEVTVTPPTTNTQPKNLPSRVVDQAKKSPTLPPREDRYEMDDDPIEKRLREVELQAHVTLNPKHLNEE